MSKEEGIIQVDIERLSQLLNQFVKFIAQKDSTAAPISFADKARYLGRTEYYKSDIFVKAGKELNSATWKKADIGSGKISNCAIKAVASALNLVNHNQQIHFYDKVKGNIETAERILYSIYCENDDKTAFEDAVSFWGAKYDLIAYLFYIKDNTRYLPISSGNFDKAFAFLNIQFSTAYRCSWDNYLKYIGIIAKIRDIMEYAIQYEKNISPRLIDAHSFVWIISHSEFQSWNPSKEESEEIEQKSEETKKLIESVLTFKEYLSRVANRNPAVAKEAKRRAKGVCQLCGEKAPFLDKQGEPYLESHHIIWISKGGADSTENTVALCPNCHKKMHILNLTEDVEYLKAIIG